MRGAHARSLPFQTHDSAASSASATPPRFGFVSQSLPSTPAGSKSAKDPSPLGDSSSLLQRSGRGSGGAVSREGTADQEGADGVEADTSQLAAKAFSAAGQDAGAEPLSVALQMKAAAAIAAELPEAAIGAAETLEAKVQDISATAQAQRVLDVPPAAQAPASQDDSSDDRVPLELLTRPTGRRSRASLEMPAQAPEQPLAGGSEFDPRPSYLSPEDDEPEPLSMSIKGGLASQQEPATLEVSQAAQDEQASDEPEPLSMSMKGGSLRPSLAPVPAEKSFVDEPEPLSRSSRKSDARSESSNDAASDSSLLGSTESFASLLAKARDYAPPAASAFISGASQQLAAGQPGQADGQPGQASEPEPLTAARKHSAGPQSIRAGTPRPSDRLKPRECLTSSFAA